MIETLSICIGHTSRQKYDTEHPLSRVSRPPRTGQHRTCWWVRVGRPPHTRRKNAPLHKFQHILRQKTSSVDYVLLLYRPIWHEGPTNGSRLSDDPAVKNGLHRPCLMGVNKNVHDTVVWSECELYCAQRVHMIRSSCADTQTSRE